MTWLEHHRRSEDLAGEAELEAHRGELRARHLRARQLYAEAAAAETCALQEIDTSKSRTLGVLAVSAVSLYYKANQLSDAESVAYHWLASGHLPPFAAAQLRGLLQSIWSEQNRK